MENHGHCSIFPQYHLDTLRTGQFGRRGAVEARPDSFTGHQVEGNPDSGQSRREATRSDAFATQRSTGVS